MFVSIVKYVWKHVRNLHMFVSIVKYVWKHVRNLHMFVSIVNYFLEIKWADLSILGFLCEV